MLFTGVTLAFDLDGTLVDTAPDLIGVLNAMLDEHGLAPVPLASARHLVGRGAAYLLEHGFREAGAAIPAEAAPVLLDRFIALYLARIAEESRPFEGVADTLDLLSSSGARLCVCTNKRTDLSIALLSALDLLDRFAVVAGADAVSARKPDRAHFIEAVRMAGGDPARAAMVGDSYPDLASARGAGAPVVLTTFGYSEELVQSLGADALVDRFSQLPEVLATLMSGGRTRLQEAGGQA